MRSLTPFFNSRSLTPTDLWREMDRMFDHFATPGLPVYDEREFAPASELTEEENHYMLSMDLPGMKKEDIKIEVADGTLVISGERKHEKRTDANQVHRFEKSYGTFKRSFVLPNTISADKVEARYEDGVLELYLPKTEVASARKIEIQSGKGGIFDKLLGDRKQAQNANKEVPVSGKDNKA
ncbi:Hsp20/alpha crystallin family protein [Pseudobdellovibrio sp. HCB154]|uniref:Hsp20/alpha crystallin family protein n=1 Tax=Pseudobdellovibrio sp. HCB154 TaxID=3386277 RepID=UPI0039172167